MSTGLLHHMEIYVTDLNRTIDFWSWFLEELGYTLFQDWRSGRSWKIGDTYIVFVQTEDRFLDIPYHRCRVGLNHLAFYASSRQHVDDMTNKLKEKGIKILYPNKHPFDYFWNPNWYSCRIDNPFPFRDKQLSRRGYTAKKRLAYLPSPFWRHHHRVYIYELRKGIFE